MSKGDMVNRWGKCCLSCHFLLKRSYVGPEDHAFSVTCGERRKLAEGTDPGEVFGNERNMECSKHVWDYANLHIDLRRHIRELLQQDRGESCFFYPFAEGMFLPAAVELERRAADRREAERDRALTRGAFWVAFAALVVSILATVATLAWNIWTHFYPATP